MATHDKTCSVCRQPFTAVRSDAETCSLVCRQAKVRRRAAARRDVLCRMTAAITTGGDPAVLSALAREAERLQ